MDEKVLPGCLKRRRRGRENAALSSVPEIRFGIRDAALRDIVNELRRRGHRIRDEDSRYYYAATVSELAATIRKLYSRFSKATMVGNDLVDALEKYTDSGQTRLPF